MSPSRWCWASPRLRSVRVIVACWQKPPQPRQAHSSDAGEQLETRLPFRGSSCWKGTPWWMSPGTDLAGSHSWRASGKQRGVPTVVPGAPAQRQTAQVKPLLGLRLTGPFPYHPKGAGLLQILENKAAPPGQRVVLGRSVKEGPREGGLGGIS